MIIIIIIRIITVQRVHYEQTGYSGLVVREVPGSNRAADKKFVFSRKSLQYAALGTGCTLTAVPRSTQPSTLRGTINEVSTPSLSNNTNGSAYSSLQADSQVKFAAWPTSRRPPGADRLSSR